MVASAVPTGHALCPAQCAGTVLLEGVCKVPAGAPQAPKAGPSSLLTPRSLCCRSLEPPFVGTCYNCILSVAGWAG